MDLQKASFYLSATNIYTDENGDFQFNIPR